MVNWKSLKTKIPPRVQVAKNVYYEICWVDAFRSPETLGETRFDTRQILIKLGMSPKETVTTYLHELGHALSAEYNANLTEAQVLALESALYFMLKDSNVFKGKKNGKKR
jgi:hypothetical protein